MTESRVPSYLRRYTDLPALLHLLSSKQLTLLDPKTWDDKNDLFFMSTYKEKRRFKTLLALCFSQAPETYHHWRVFSNGPAGVCVVFNRVQLLEDFGQNHSIRCGSMEYLTLPNAKKRKFEVDELPFLKRYGYKPENEFRAVYTSQIEEVPSLQVPIRIRSIRSISLSPWMHDTLSKSTMKAICAIEGCTELKVSRSTLISNEQWKRYGSGAE